MFVERATKQIRGSATWREYLVQRSAMAKKQPDSDANRDIVVGPRASSASEEAVTAPPRAADAYSNRVAWLKERLREREHMSRTRVQSVGGPNNKTVKRILDGRPVREESLDKLAQALSYGGFKVSREDIPND